MMWGWDGYGTGYGPMGFFGPFFMILFWGLIIGGVVMLVRMVLGRDGRMTDGTKKEDSALRILRERYAKGEITKEEFEERQKGLRV
jgi:putative membrane protein